MHELSIAMSILDVVSEHALLHGERPVRAVHLRLGPLSGVVKEALISAYELAREGTDLAESHLVIEEVPIRVFCPRCVAERRVLSIQELCCEICGMPAPEVMSGRELEVTAMEIVE